jgi:hypothetical protein
MSNGKRFIPPRQNIGPSKYATILGYSRFQTSEDLQKELEEGVIIGESNAAINLGINKEDTVRKLYENIKNVKVDNANWIRKGRILGKADGLIGEDGGLEVKCHLGRTHPMIEVPIYHLVQIVGYMHLYKRQWWDVISCCFNADSTLGKYRIHRIYWKKYERAWEDFWYPQILDFIKGVKWSTKNH